ncbi:MAG: hypothetical protein WD601_13535, partial [Pseudohongiellaceae bacterium]
MSDSYVQMVIIDPTQDKQIALDRAIITSQIRNPRPKMHIFIGVDTESVDTRASNPALYRDTRWLGTITGALEKEGLEYECEFCWSSEWDEAVLESAKRCKPVHIFMPDYQLKRRNLFSNQQWSLLRHAKVP